MDTLDILYTYVCPTCFRQVTDERARVFHTMPTYTIYRKKKSIDTEFDHVSLEAALDCSLLIGIYMYAYQSNALLGDSMIFPAFNLPKRIRGVIGEN